MNQPTDRLGQPLAVGDWVRVNCPCGLIEAGLDAINDGNHKILNIDVDEDGDFYAIISEGKEFDAAAACDVLTKINPKQETTTWDKCVWAPESINLTL